MPRTLTGSIACSRVIISLAALLVKVTAMTPPGEIWPVDSSQAMRVVSTRVLPEPAPARISACVLGSVTAASCSGLRFCRRGELGTSGDIPHCRKITDTGTAPGYSPYARGRFSSPAGAAGLALPAPQAQRPQGGRGYTQ